MTQTINKEIPAIVKECRFVVYVEPPQHGMPDLHLIKEQIHSVGPDGKNTLTPNVIF